jgi:hypothetical protein
MRRGLSVGNGGIVKSILTVAAHRFVSTKNRIYIASHPSRCCFVGFIMPSVSRKSRACGEKLDGYPSHRKGSLGSYISSGFRRLLFPSLKTVAKIIFANGIDLFCKNCGEKFASKMQTQGTKSAFLGAKFLTNFKKILWSKKVYFMGKIESH